MSGTPSSSPRGIISAAGYVPYRRLDRSEIAAVAGQGGGRGTRTVASYDEDTTTLAVEAARYALKAAPAANPQLLLFSTVAPAYLDKTNATTIHAALNLDSDVPALDVNGALRSAVGALFLGLGGSGTVLVTASDIRTGLPGSGEEAGSGDAGSAVLIGDATGGNLIAEHLGGAARTDEFIDRWRTPGDYRSKTWEERFGETVYVPLAAEAYEAGLKAAGLSADDVTAAVVTGPHTRAVNAAIGKLGLKDKVVDSLAASIGYAGSASAFLLLASALEQAKPGQVIALVSMADGVDVAFFRTTDAIASYRPTRSVAFQVANGASLPYGKFLNWRGVLPVEPPRRPEPNRISASISSRTEGYKYGFIGSKDRSSGAPHLPPQRVSREGGHQDEMDPLPMSDAEGTISTFTIDRIAYSPSPPIVFAVVDFDNGARLPVELCDVDASTLAMGDRVEMTFRRLFTADGIHNYFWKARPVRAEA